MFTIHASPAESRLATVWSVIHRGLTTAIAVSLGVVVATSAVAAGPDISVGATVAAPAERGAQVQVNPPPAPLTARYRVTININWTGATHPGTLPGNAHVSSPIIAVHGAPGAMFAVGGQASSGIEAMAERGTTGTLVAELAGNDQVTRVATVSGVPAPAVGSRTVDLDVLQRGHRISLVTMLAPSPDWFVGFADRATFVDGQWIDSVTFPLGNYDAGTDSGSSFTSANADTQPQQPISGPDDATFATAAARNPFGTVTITRIG
jgi:hypothetical protein